MTRNRTAARPVLESLEGRLALSAASPAAAARAPAATIAVLKAFTQAYPSRVGNANYNPAFDLNRNGQVGQDDGKILLHQLAPVAPPIPLQLQVTLGPADRARGHTPKNSGGVTHNRDVLVYGRTTPGALVFTGTGTIDVKLRGPAYVADAQGNFAVPFTNRDGINQFDLLAVDAYGRQVLRAYPIYWLDFARYEAAHPRNT